MALATAGVEPPGRLWQVPGGQGVRRVRREAAVRRRERRPADGREHAPPPPSRLRSLARPPQGTARRPPDRPSPRHRSPLRREAPGPACRPPALCRSSRRHRGPHQGDGRSTPRTRPGNRPPKDRTHPLGHPGPPRVLGGRPPPAPYEPSPAALRRAPHLGERRRCARPLPRLHPRSGAERRDPAFAVPRHGSAAAPPGCARPLPRVLRRPQLWKAFADHDVLVMPSTTFEAMGLVALEAPACGLPVLGADRAASRSSWPR